MDGFSTVRKVILLLALPVALAVTACGSSSESMVVFVSTVDGDEEIYSLDVKSGEATPLTDNRGRDFGPRWSPDGENIVYLSDQAGDLEINLLDREGETLTRLTHSIGDERSPLWSPSGDRLAFISQQEDNPEVYLMNSEGGNLTRVTSNSAEDRLGDWSPGGEWLVFFRNPDDPEKGLWLRNPDGVNLVHLTLGEDSDPAWSANGREIAFVRTEEGNSDIWVARKPKNGTWQDQPEVEQLTSHQEDDLSPVWSPDGKTIAFVSFQDGNAEIYSMPSDGSKQRRLTSNGADDLTPVWSPDGKGIAFVSYIYGAGEIFVMGADGSKQRRLTNNTSEDKSPDW